MPAAAAADGRTKDHWIFTNAEHADIYQAMGPELGIA
jgi:hypothetical protein